MSEAMRRNGRGLLVAFFTALGVVMAFGAGPCDRDSGSHWCQKPQTATAAAAIPGQFPWLVIANVLVLGHESIHVEATLTGGPPGQGQAKVIAFAYNCSPDPPAIPLFEWEDPALDLLAATLTKPDSHSWSKAAAKGLVLVMISP